MSRIPDLQAISTKQRRIAQLAREDRQRALTSLAHNIDLDWLHEAYRRTRKDGAVGVDRQTAEQYAAKLDENLASLLDRAKSGHYRAPPVKRVHIPKGPDGATRPIGIPTFEDKVLQRAVAMVLECVYEQDFLDCSHGFRPGRSALGAGQAVRDVLAQRGGWVVELDIRKFFDTLDHEQLREILRLRIRDGVLLRLIGKWLNAGVLEAGAVTHPEAGTPQGGVISPILANIYLDHVLDQWFANEVKPRLKSGAELVRYADDAIIVCHSEQDARRVLAVLPKRFGKFSLTLHPDKTRLVRFARPVPERNDRHDDHGGGNGPESFDFLGFTFYWGRTRRGGQAVLRKTAKDRLARAIARVGTWCRAHLHDAISAQHQTLCRAVQGHYAYYGVTGNSRQIGRFVRKVEEVWHKWLARRSNSRRRPWSWFALIRCRFPLPPPRIVHKAVTSHA